MADAGDLKSLTFTGIPVRVREEPLTRTPAYIYRLRCSALEPGHLTRLLNLLALSSRRTLMIATRLSVLAREREREFDFAETTRRDHRSENV
jgi:hypothetical protein